MNQTQIAKQMVEFNKSIFDNSFTAMSALQEQTEKLIISFLEKAAWLPDEGKKPIYDWIASYQKGRDDFKATADERYKKVVEYFAKTGK